MLNAVVKRAGFPNIADNLTRAARRFAQLQCADGKQSSPEILDDMAGYRALQGHAFHVVGKHSFADEKPCITRHRVGDERVLPALPLAHVFKNERNGKQKRQIAGAYVPVVGQRSVHGIERSPRRTEYLSPRPPEAPSDPEQGCKECQVHRYPDRKPRDTGNTNAVQQVKQVKAGAIRNDFALVQLAPDAAESAQVKRNLRENNRENNRAEAACDEASRSERVGCVEYVAVRTKRNKEREPPENAPGFEKRKHGALLSPERFRRCGDRLSGTREILPEVTIVIHRTLSKLPESFYLSKLLKMSFESFVG